LQKIKELIENKPEYIWQTESLVYVRPYNEEFKMDIKRIFDILINSGADINEKIRNDD